LQHPITGILQLLIVAAVLPWLHDGGRAALLLALMLLHPDRIRALVDALVRARWLLLALAVAAALPQVIAGHALETPTWIAAASHLAPLLILITAVTVWVSPHDRDSLAGALGSALKPLRVIGLDPLRPATILTGTLTAIPATLVRVQALRAPGGDRLGGVAALVREAEAGPPAPLTAGSTSTVPDGAWVIAAIWAFCLLAAVALGL